MNRIAIERFAPSSYSELLTFLLEDPANNLFLIADLQQFGLDHPHLSYYGGYLKGQLVGVFMVYRRNGSLYWHHRRVLAGFADLARKQGMKFITGCRRQVDPLLENFTPEEVTSSEECIYCQLAPDDFRGMNRQVARKATTADVEALAHFYTHNFGFAPGSRQQHRERVIRTVENNTLYFVEEDGRVASAALSSVEGGGMAMIGGVATLESERNRGYAAACVGALCADLLARNLTPYLFYKVGNRPAQRVYEKIGFQPIGRWLLVKLDLR